MHAIILYEHALDWASAERPDFTAQLAAWRQERPERLTDADLLAEYAWVVVGCGLTYAACRRQHERVSSAAGSWEPAAVVQAAERIAAAYRNQRKRAAILDMAAYLLGHPGEMARLAAKPLAAAHATVGQWPFVGAVNRYQFLRNLGFDEVAHAGPVVRLAAMLQTTPEALCELIATACGERLRVVDLVLWQWAESATHTEQWYICQLAQQAVPD